MKNTLSFILFLSIIGFISCKSEGETSVVTNEAVTALENELKQSPTLETANKLISELSKSIGTYKDNPNGLKATLDRGIELSKEYKVPTRAIPFMLNYLKNYPTDPSSKDKMFDLASMMVSIKKDHASNVLFKSFAQSYPEDPRAQNISSKLSEPIDDLDAYVLKQGEKIFENPDQFGLNKIYAQNYVDVCEAYALGNPTSPTAPVNLYKAAEIARSLRTFPKTLSLYDWIGEKYPDYDKAPTTLFLKGFIIENELKNTDLAKEIYTEFLNKYPNHDLADDVKFLVENIGKSNEEILKIIENKKGGNTENSTPQ